MSDSVVELALAVRDAADDRTRAVLRAIVADACNWSRLALKYLPETCRYHGSDFDHSGWQWGAPRCETCRPAHARQRAAAALDALGGIFD